MAPLPTIRTVGITLMYRVYGNIVRFCGGFDFGSVANLLVRSVVGMHALTHSLCLVQNIRLFRVILHLNDKNLEQIFL